MAKIPNSDKIKICLSILAATMFGDTLLKNIKVISLAPLVLMILINVPLDGHPPFHWNY